jgi:integrase
VPATGIVGRPAPVSAGGPADPAGLGAGDFTRILDAISAQRRADGTLYSASHRNLMIYQFCQVIEYGRASGLMATVPDPFRPATRHRVRDDPNEDEVGKALPETVIRQLDARLQLLGPAGRAGAIPARGLQLMHQTIYQIMRDTGRRPGEVVSLRTGCIEIIGGQHNLIYDNHKAGRMRRRLPVTTGTAQIIQSWQQHRMRLRLPPAQNHWLFPRPLLRARQSRGHVTPACVGRVFKIWVAQIGTIDSELPGPDGTPVPFEPSLITPYALRHSYAQRHADAGVPVDVLKELMDHAAVATTMGYYQVSLKRKQQAIRSVGPLATDASGDPAPFASPTAYQRAPVAVPFGNCTEPSNVTAGGGACPIRFQCAGCGFYRPDPSYLPALEQHIAGLRADRETARAMDAAGYVLASLTAEIDAFTQVAEAMHRKLSQMDPAQRAEIEEASKILRRARAARTLPLIPHAAPVTETA